MRQANQRTIAFWLCILVALFSMTMLVLGSILEGWKRPAYAWYALAGAVSGAVGIATRK